MMKVVYTNAQSVLKKMDELRSYVTMNEPDVILLTETWTNEQINDDFLKLEGYELVAREDRKDTSGGRGGGILAFVKKEMSGWRVEEETIFNQCVHVKVKTEEGDDVSIKVVYRSPNLSRQNDEELCRWMRTITGRTCVIEDFNFPGINWSAGRRLLSNMLQLVLKPTRD